jgi:hypothetical protein
MSQLRGCCKGNKKRFKIRHTHTHTHTHRTISRQIRQKYATNSACTALHPGFVRCIQYTDARVLAHLHRENDTFLHGEQWKEAMANKEGASEKFLEARNRYDKNKSDENEDELDRARKDRDRAEEIFASCHEAKLKAVNNVSQAFQAVQSPKPETSGGEFIVLHDAQTTTHMHNTSTAIFI